eukprot:TRINITY_DN8577_c0_g2_i22.p1 TRINITY_DN8577_c0_g2~~TRINITY_DN8577_c0_g2_i22.p1  ORF type:complete len:1138 (-),score=251.32 TRINITY_DN8577_c0_g2_i22:249-3161(-)
MEVTHRQLQLTVFQSLGQKHKNIGQCPNLDLVTLAEVGIQEMTLPLNTKPGFHVKIKLGWYGTGARAQKATEDLRFASMKIYTETDVQEIAQKILKYEKELSQLQQGLAEIMEKNEPYEHFLSKYRDVDDEAREVISGVEDASMERESSVTSYLEFLKDGTAKSCAEFFLKNDDLEHIPEIKSTISGSGPLWCKQFLAQGGLKNVVDTFASIESKVYQPKMNVKVAQLASVIKSLMNDQSVAAEMITKHSNELKLAVKTSLTSKNPLVKAQMFAFFSALCLYGRVSHNIVLSALIELGPEGQHFSSLINVIKTERDREVITSAMMLINALLAGEKEIGARHKFRENFNTNGLLVHTEHLREHLLNERGLIVQFDMYLAMAKADEEELQRLRFTEKVDLFSEVSVFNLLSDEVDKLEQGEAFLRHLQHLLLLPHVCGDTKNAWQLIEKSSRRATTSTEKDAQDFLTITELNRTFRSLHSDKKQAQLREMWNSNRQKPPLPPGARTVKNALVAPKIGILPPGSFEDKDNRVSHDPTVPEPRRKMKPIFWVSKYKEGENLPEYWQNASLEITALGTMFEDLQERFYQPKTKNIREQKISLLPLPVANAISIWRAQFPHVDDQAIIQDIFDIENSAGTIFTYHFEALLSAIPKEADLVQLRKYKGSLENLQRPDQFLITLLQVPRLSQKLSNLIFWDEFENNIYTCDVTKDKMAEMCNVVLDNPSLHSALQTVMSLAGLLDSNNHGTNRPHSVSRLRSATLLATGGPRNPSSLEQASDRATKAKGLTDPELENYMASFVGKTYSELKGFSDEIILFEKAWRFQPEIMSRIISSLETGYAALVEDLDHIPEEIDPLYAQYFDAMSQFCGYAGEQIQRIKQEFEEFEQHSLLVLHDFGITSSQDPVKDLWCTFHLFTKHFKLHMDSLQANKDEDARRKRLEVRQARTNPLLDSDNSDKEFGTIDKLIASIREGFLG